MLKVSLKLKVRKMNVCFVNKLSEIYTSETSLLFMKPFMTRPFRLN